MSRIIGHVVLVVDYPVSRACGSFRRVNLKNTTRTPLSSRYHQKVPATKIQITARAEYFHPIRYERSEMGRSAT